MPARTEAQPSGRAATRPRKASKTHDDDDQVVSLLAGGAVPQTQYSVGQNLTPEQEAEWLAQLNRRLEIVLLAQKTISRGTLNAIADSKSEDISYRSELTRLAQEYSVVLNEQQEEITSLTSQLTDHDNEIIDLRNLNNVLQEQIKNTDTASVSLHNEKSRLQQVVDDVNKRYDVLLASSQRLEQELKRVTVERQELLDQLREDEEDNHDDDQQDEDSNDLEALLQNVTSHQRLKRTQLLQLKNALFVKLSVAEKQLANERSLYQKETDSLHEQLDAIEEEYEQARIEWKTDLKQLQQDHQNALEAAEQRVQDSVQDDIEELKRQHQLELDQKDAQIQALEGTKAALESQIENATDEAMQLAVNNTSLEAQIELLKEKNSNILQQHKNDVIQYENHLREVSALIANDRGVSTADSLGLHNEVDEYARLLAEKGAQVAASPQPATADDAASPASSQSSLLTTPRRRLRQVVLKSSSTTAATTVTLSTPVAPTEPRRSTRRK